MDEYITLVSNASMDLFPENRLSSFRTRLPYLHNFSEGNWSVALTELTYTKSWFNVSDHHTVSPAYVDDSAPVASMKHAIGTKIKPGHYDKPEQLIEHINSLMASWPKPKTITKQPVLEIKSNQKVALKTTGEETLSPNIVRDFGALFSAEMAEILGITGNRPAYLDQGMTSLFLYCDVVQPQVVGDTFAPLLRTVGVSSDVPFGQNVTEIFESPYYLPLSRSIFQEVTLDIRSDTGAAPSFNFGRVTATLHFRAE